MPEQLYPAIIDAIKSNQKKTFIKYADEAGENTYYIHPSYDDKNKIFSVLIQKSLLIKKDTQRLNYALHDLYSNYLILIEKVRHDKLTNLLNRETLDDEVTKILLDSPHKELVLEKNFCESDEQREKHKKPTYWLGLLDIDFFKSINDTYGHLYGDDVLILVARLIEKNVRNFDMVFRYGGEEFVILLRAPDMDIAYQAFERIRTVIQSYPFGKVEQLTVSIGITRITHQSGSSEIIGYADEALYYAKENGRNQICFYENLVSQHLLPSNTEEDSNINYL